MYMQRRLALTWISFVLGGWRSKIAGFVSVFVFLVGIAFCEVLQGKVPAAVFFTTFPCVAIRKPPGSGDAGYPLSITISLSQILFAKLNIVL